MAPPADAREELTYFGRDLEAMSFARNYHRWIAEEFAPYLGARVAEVGAGTGNFSELLLSQGPIAHLMSFEPSSNMYPLLQRRMAGSPRVQTVNDFFGSRAAGLQAAFDSVCYVNVLEHIEADRDELALVRGTLKSGGHLLVFVPALPFLYSGLDRQLGHFRRYRKGELVQLVEGAGFQLRQVKYFDLAGVLPWYVAFVLLKRPLTGGSVSMYDRFVLPLTRRIEQAVAPPIGKNLLLIARNP